MKDTGSGRKVGFWFFGFWFWFGKTECGSFGDPGTKLPKKLLVTPLQPAMVKIRKRSPAEDPTYFTIPKMLPNTPLVLSGKEKTKKKSPKGFPSYYLTFLLTQSLGQISLYALKWGSRESRY